MAVSDSLEVASKATESIVQSGLATAGAFIVAFVFLTFFEDLFKVKGFFRFLLAGLIAYLFYEYWYIVLEKIEAGLEVFGLKSVS